MTILELDVAHVREWAAQHTPEQYCDEVRIEVDEAHRGLTIFECRPPRRDSIGPEWTRNPIARLSSVKKRREWALYWADRNSRFQKYLDLTPSRHVGELLAEIDADPVCIFWVERATHHQGASRTRSTQRPNTAVVHTDSPIVKSEHELRPWFWEGNVQETLRRHLAGEGWTVEPTMARSEGCPSRRRPPVRSGSGSPIRCSG